MKRFYNRTRTAPSIPRKLIREGKIYLLPVYYLLWTSELGREGIRNSGSYRFADHIYEGSAKGRYGIGRLVDALLLRLRSAESMRARHVYSKKETVALILERRGTHKPVDVLSVPCGLARELVEIDEYLTQSNLSALPDVRFHGMDLDGELIDTLKASLNGRVSLRVGDALDERSYTKEFDVIISNGFTDFLDDTRTVDFYKLVRQHLKPEGHFVTSGMRAHRFSEYLMRNLAELNATYRSSRELKDLARAGGFKEIRTYQDKHGLQTMLIGVKT